MKGPPGGVFGKTIYVNCIRRVVIHCLRAWKNEPAFGEAVNRPELANETQNLDFRCKRG